MPHTKVMCVCSILTRIVQPFSKAVVPIFIPTGKVWEFPSLYMHATFSTASLKNIFIYYLLQWVYNGILIDFYLVLPEIIKKNEEFLRFVGSHQMYQNTYNGNCGRAKRKNTDERKMVENFQHMMKNINSTHPRSSAQQTLHKTNQLKRSTLGHIINLHFSDKRG